MISDRTTRATRSGCQTYLMDSRLLLGMGIGPVHTVSADSTLSIWQPGPGNWPVYENRVNVRLLPIVCQLRTPYSFRVGLSLP